MRVGFRRARRFHAQAYFSRPGLAGGEFQGPNRQDLRTLIDTLEAFLGFGYGLDGCDPKLFGKRGLDGGGDVLPLIDNS